MARSPYALRWAASGPLSGSVAAHISMGDGAPPAIGLVRSSTVDVSSMCCYCGLLTGGCRRLGVGLPTAAGDVRASLPPSSPRGRCRAPVARSPYALRWAVSGPLSGSVAAGAPVGVGDALCVVRPQRHRRASQGRPLGRSSLFFISAVIANDLPEIMVSPHLLRFVLWSEWKADVFLPSRHQHTALGLSV